ncbi:GCN5-related N-acetyltransferase [Desulfocucumis palustris]|uniref:GCN5-related N-acetyltransferase n=1 Tax=Desulfocucumis palustris TaxID=1898651 RepID=A0A2L2XFF1_9FIRM|nr:GNAT family N-acetyltransferase [Desulfocucumis palustris]GBF35079.1 GCN5-related N-acetyltransferase [Desulfocucumis palustris]
MLRLEQAGADFSEIISELIMESFSQQAKILGITEKEYPNFVAFETPGKVSRRIKRGERVVLGYLLEKPVGTVSYKMDDNAPAKGYIKRLAVLPEFRGKGYGALLLDYAERRLLECGANRVEISIVAQFRRLMEYYRSLGYRPVEVKVFNTLPFEVLYLEKTINL